MADYDFLEDGNGDGSGGETPNPYDNGPDPESGSFVGPGGTDPNGQTPGDYSEQWRQAGEGLDENGNGPQDPGFNWQSTAGQAIMRLGQQTGGAGAPNWAQKALSTFGLGGNNPMSNPFFVPAMTAAYKQWKDADKYNDMGTEAEHTANPFGDRSQYVKQLSDLYKDPSSIENTPGYKFSLDQGLGSMNSKLAAMGYLGSGKMRQDDMKFAQGLAEQTWDKEANRLATLGGAQFDPANAAKMKMQGGQLAIQSQNGALDAFMTPFLANAYGPGGQQGPQYNGSQPAFLHTDPSTGMPYDSSYGMNDRSNGGAPVYPPSDVTIDDGPNENFGMNDRSNGTNHWGMNDRSNGGG
jgi:hypothetical protein